MHPLACEHSELLGESILADLVACLGLRQSGRDADESDGRQNTRIHQEGAWNPNQRSGNQERAELAANRRAAFAWETARADLSGPEGRE